MRAFDFASRSGFGVVAGAVSARRECWDFDDGDVFEAFVHTVAACGLGAIVDPIVAGYCDATPGGGGALSRHLFRRRRDAGSDAGAASWP